MEQELWLKKNPHCSGDPEEDLTNQSTVVWTQAMERVQGLYRQIRNFIGDRANCAFCLANKVTIPVWVLIIIALVGAFSGIAILYSAHSGSAAVLSPDPPPGPCCLDGWVGYQGKCYYFSEAKENWTYSQSHCSALGASLAVIDSKQEMRFLLRYKGNLNHWLGLWRGQDQDQPWKWANGTEFNNQFEIGGGGHCAYLSDGFVGSSGCTSLTNWICSKHDAYTVGKETAQSRI
ncbi:C-type lectin domain family 2 member D-like isoform 1-T1 [Pangshura tecta]